MSPQHSEQEGREASLLPDLNCGAWCEEEALCGGQRPACVRCDEQPQGKKGHLERRFVKTSENLEAKGQRTSVQQKEAGFADKGGQDGGKTLAILTQRILEDIHQEQDLGARMEGKSRREEKEYKEKKKEMKGGRGSVHFQDHFQHKCNHRSQLCTKTTPSKVASRPLTCGFSLNLLSSR